MMEMENEPGQPDQIDTDSVQDAAIITPAGTPVSVVKDDPRKPYKAYASAVATFLVLFAGMWIADDDPFTKKEAVQALVTAFIGSGLSGGAAYQVKNPKKTV